jgi:hypothetical protein
MMFKSFTCAAAVLALLAGCGGASSPSRATSASLAAASSPVIAADIVIDAEGDSTMYGLETVDGRFVQSAHPVPALVQAQLRGWFGANLTVNPNGSSGANLIRFVDTVRASGKLPVLEEPNPVCVGHEALDQLVGILNTVAGDKAVPLVKQYEAIKALPGWRSMLTDCVHPNDALYAFKAGREAEALAQVIRSASW